MITIERFFWGHMLAATAALAVGYALVPGYGICWMVIVLIGLVWFATQQRKTQGFEGLMLFAYGILAGAGFFVHAPAWLMMVGLAASLGAWDLHTFLLRLGSADRVEYESGLGRAHLRRLGFVELGGLLLGLAALTVHPQVGFWWAGLLALVAVVGISRLIARIRKETE